MMILEPSRLDMIWIICFVIFLVPLRCIVKRRLSKLPLPPGPPKLPLVGNLLHLPSFQEYEVYRVWGKEYGSQTGFIHLDAAGSSIIILNSAKVASDLLEKRSRIYSSRPPWPMGCDLMGWNWNFAFQQYGDSWRVHRRIFQEAFTPSSTKLFLPQQVKATNLLLDDLLAKPEPYLGHLKHYAARVIMMVAYGIEVQHKDDPYVKLVEEAIKPLMDAMIPGAFLVDSFPILKRAPSWVPGAGFQRKAQIWRELALRLVNQPFAAGKRMIESGNYSPSFISSALQNIEEDASTEHKKKEDLIRETAGSMYLAGADTTVAAVASFIFAMLTAPDVQRRAQEEIDRVVPGRLPMFEDERDMPYVTALVWESLRWKCVAPLALPHYLDVEDEYEGYRIPGRSVVIGNVWAILHDEDVYPEPFDFKPERFLKNRGQELDESFRDAIFTVFGFGRRICPGRNMAYTSLWIVVASMLKTFNISKARDEQGNVIEPVYEPHSSIIATPFPFKCSIKPRSVEAESLIKTAVDEYELSTNLT